MTLITFSVMKAMIYSGYNTLNANIFRKYKPMQSSSRPCDEEDQIVVQILLVNRCKQYNLERNDV